MNEPRRLHAERTASHYFYCDRTIEDGSKCVLLLGGFTGYQNFGDILQLKHAISFHKSTTGLTPVVICDIECIADPGYPGKLYERFGVDYIIFCSKEYYDVKALHLKVMESPVHIPCFQIYGGGFLNPYWAEWFLSVAADVIDFFGVGHYLLSGQQLDRKVTDRLKHFFEAYKPALIGCRDEESFALAKEIAPYAAVYSFDDAFECLSDISRCVTFSKEVDGRQTILLHLNLSRHIHDKTAMETLEVYKDVLRDIKSHYGYKSLDVVLLIAYNDSRINAVADMPVVLQALEDEFDFTGARILNLANLALSYKANCGLDVPLQIPRSALLITTSYHTALMGLVMGIGTYLFEENAYYRQKHAGLHFKEHDLRDFLENSDESGWSEKDWQYFREAREKWHRRLAESYRKEPDALNSCAGPALNVPVLPFVFKMEKNDPYRHIRTLQQHINECDENIKEKEKHIETLQSEIKEKREKLEALYGSNGWRFLTRYYAWRDKIFPPYTGRRRLAQKILSSVVKKRNREL